MKRWLILFVTIICGYHTWAQTSRSIQLKGHLYDAQSKKGLPGASVALLKDTSKLGITLTNDSGAFQLNIPSPAEYILSISYLGYKSEAAHIDLKTVKDSIDMGNLYLQRTGVTLNEIDIIISKPPIRVAKDTIEFDTKNYETREHSPLEELLRKLPGVQVDENGVIRINGEIITTILIEGRPFFSNNSNLIAKNLQADIIDKIQMIDRAIKERNPSAFDGEKTEKVINITLKKESKNIWSGELTTAVGMASRFAVKTNIIKFKDHEQLAMLMNGDNINDNGSGPGNSVGMSRKWNPNLNYSRDINEKITYAGSLSILDNKTEDNRTSSRETFSSDTSYFYDQKSSQNTKTTASSLNSQLTYKINPLLSVNYSINSSYSSDKTKLTNIHGTYGNKHQILDSGTVENNGNISTFNISNQISVNKKFKKTGYYMNVSLAYSKALTQENNYNLSNTLYVQTDGKNILDTLNQYNKINNNSNFLQLMIMQGVPISNKGTLSLSYFFTSTNSFYLKYAYNHNPITNRYDSQIDTLSGNFKNTSKSHFARLSIESRNDKIDYSISLNGILFDLNSNTPADNSDPKYRSIVFIPRASLNYNFGNNRKFRFLLNGNPILPDAEQLRPIPDNSNPLSIKTGNANLKTGRSHNIDLSYNSFNATNTVFFMLGLHGTYLHNQIINAINLDSLRRQISTPLNISGSYEIGLNTTISTPFKNSKNAISAISSLSLRKDMNYTNHILGNNKNFTISQIVSYNYSHKDQILMNTSINFAYNRTVFAAPYSEKTNYLSYGITINGSIKLPLELYIGSEVKYILTTGRSEQYNTNAFVLNPFISKSIFHNKKGIAKLQAFDLFNQNVSVTRTINPGYIEDVKTNVLQRLFMLSFSYYLKQQKDAGKN